jgi:leucyl aminopeptidase
MRIPLVAALFACLPAAALAQDRSILFSQAVPPGEALVLPLSSTAELQTIAPLDNHARAEIARTLENAAFNFEIGSKMMLTGVGPWHRVLVVGTGSGRLTTKALQDLGGTAMQELADTKGAVVVLDSPGRAESANSAAEMAIGAKLGGYSFDKYKSKEPAKPKPPIGSVTFVSPNLANASVFEARGRPLLEGVYFSRDLIREPANVLYPEEFVARTRAAFKGVPNVTVKALEVPQMGRLGMGAILSVGKGSVRPPRMLIVEYRGSAGAPLLAIAGKGITFDSGGISIKPGTGMWAMKGDMAGAATVVGTALSLAKSRAPVNVVAIAALAENMPSGSATRPGDVVTAMNGKTIEVLNTDAEGRLVLADAMTYAERFYRPAAIVDVATLTGAVGTALGDEYAGLFSRSDALAQQLAAAGSATGEELWRLPLHPNYAKDMTSKIADIQNVVEGGGPGAGLGAHFIGYFVESTPWAHLDIAGVDSRASSLPTVPAGLSGFGVRLLDRFIRDFRPVSEVKTPE